MALKSMTGFGRGEAAAGGLKIEVELSAVNRKQFDLRPSLPRALVALESRLHAAIREVVARGSITVSVKTGVAEDGGGGAAHVDAEAAGTCLNELRKAGEALGLQDDLTLRNLLQMPGIIRLDATPAEDTARVWPLLEKALNAALGQLLAMRSEEGKALQADISKRFEKLRQPMEQIRKQAPKVAEKYARTLRERLGKNGFDFNPEDPQLLRELALFADRSDISEELVRLDSHFAQASKLIASRAPAGRALDFLCQEMFREINTIGSKANDAAISRQVIRFKSELESIRQQVQNVE
jgi:uncharacterized protein (TIGR00255 family)